MIARLDVQKRGLEDAIMLDTQGFIAEGATESVFLVKDGRLLTPCLGTVLDSITRRSILQVARHLGIETFEGRLRPALLFEADEVFFANTPFKVIPVRRIEDRRMSAIPGPMQRRLWDVLQKIATGQEPDFAEWLYAVVKPDVEKILHGDQLAGSRLISLLEDRDPRGIEMLKALYPHAGKAFLIGITGPAGAGKSTLVSRMISCLRGRGLRVGVVAVDPSSPFTGGALLGDRIRMQGHETDPGVFIRSMAARGQAGGVSRATREAALVMDAMGYQVVLIETVGRRAGGGRGQQLCAHDGSGQHPRHG